MVNLTFYYKEGCWLCVKAEEMLNGQQEKHDITIRKIAVDANDDLYEEYKYDIPVFEFEDGSVLHGNIKKKPFLKKLFENRK